MAFLTTAISTGKGASDTVSVNDWNVGLADNLLTGVVRAIAEGATTGGGSASIDLTSLSSAFRGLQVDAVLRAATSSDTIITARMRINNDAGANYRYAQIYAYGDSTTVLPTFISSGGTSLYIGDMPTCGASTDLYAAYRVVIPDYQSTEIKKDVIVTGGTYGGTSSGLEIMQTFGAYASTAAITRLTFYAQTGNLSSGCRVTVYGCPWTSTG